jgi:phage shock protein A
MGIFSRLKDLTTANINALIDKAEDPVKMLEQYLRDMSEDISDAETAVAKQIAFEKRAKQELDEATEMVEKRQSQAVKALEQNNEELARKALEDKKEHQAKVDTYTLTHATAKANADKLRSQLGDMKDEFNKLKNKKDLLIARAESAKAQKQVNQAMSGFGIDNAKGGFDRMEEKVLQMEAEAQASSELRESSKSLDNELDSLDHSPSAIDDELAALKAQINNK